MLGVWDATLIALCVTVFDWAQYRRAKALWSSICCSIIKGCCSFAVLAEGRVHESGVVRTIGFEPGAIVGFDDDKPAVLVHRSVNVCLDKAFTLIDGERSISNDLNHAVQTKMAQLCSAFRSQMHSGLAKSLTSSMIRGFRAEKRDSCLHRCHSMPRPAAKVAAARNLAVLTEKSQWLKVSSP